MTRFYFSLGQFNESVSTDASWHSFSSFVDGALLTEPFGNSKHVGRFGVKSTTTNPKNVGVAQLVSAPFTAAGTVPQNAVCTMVVPMYEGNASEDAMIRAVVKIVSNNGGTLRGVLYLGPDDTTVAASGDVNNRELSVEVSGQPSGAARIRKLVGIVPSPVAWQVGDRLVVELGARFVQATTAGSFALWLTPNARSKDYSPIIDVLISETKRPWIEINTEFFPQTDLNPEEMRFGQAGYLLNGSAGSLPFVDLQVIDGLDSSPVRVSVANREGMHGGLVTSEFEEPRTVTLEGILYASPTALDTELDKLKKNFAPTFHNVGLYFKTDDGLVRHVMGKSQGLRYRKERDRSIGIVKFQVQIVCEDPRIYQGTAYSLVTCPALNITAFTLSGNRESPPLFTMKADSAITAGNAKFVLTTPAGFHTYTYTGAMASGDVIELDTEARTAILNGVTNVRSSILLDPSWAYLYAGSNDVQPLVSGLTVDVKYKSAWR